jgi:hypothetical protein
LECLLDHPDEKVSYSNDYLTLIVDVVVNYKLETRN